MRNNCSNFWDYTMSLWHSFQATTAKSSHLYHVISHDPEHGSYCICIYNKKTCKAKVTRVRHMTEQQALGLAWANYCGIEVPALSNLIPISRLKSQQMVYFHGIKAKYAGICCDRPLFIEAETGKKIPNPPYYVRVYY